MKTDLLLTIIILLLGVRTLGFHLQQWQIREYRWDRLREHLLRSREGKIKLFNLWLFQGILPRPKVSMRILLILFIFSFISLFLGYAVLTKMVESALAGYSENIFIAHPFVWIALLWERTIFLSVGISVFISKIPVFFVQKRLFRRAKQIISAYPDVIRIGITGSYGKSSTKEILVHLLIPHFGAENILYNPRNENNEVAIARLIVRSRKLFQRKTKRIMIIEMGAYRKGEIAKMCDYIQPQIGILTGINNQHISLFGSQQNIQEAKFELAESVTNKVFFNADSPLLAQIFDDKEIKAVKLPISCNSAKNIESHPTSTNFEVYGEQMKLPWMGKFFVQNALLAIEISRELGLSPIEIATTLPFLPPLERALNVKKLKSGAILIRDLYSANTDGVLCAIEQLEKFNGTRIFVGIPLIELGKTAIESHKLIFQKLKTLNAEIFWLKNDYRDLGLKICGKKFHGKNMTNLKKMIKEMGLNDVLLAESKLPSSIMKLINKE